MFVDKNSTAAKTFASTHNERNKKYYAGLPPEKKRKILQRTVERTRERAALIRAHCGALKVRAGCLDCGYNKCAAALHFHHVDGTKEKKISDIQTWRALDRELDKCVVLCANCHAERHNEERVEG